MGSSRGMNFLLMIQPRIDSWVQALGLEDWDITYEVGLYVKGGYAECWCDPVNHTGRIVFADSIIDTLIDEELTYVIGHELIHMLLEPILRTIESVVDEPKIDAIEAAMDLAVNRMTAIVGRAYGIVPNARP